jgi:hypothetical protein
MTSERKIAITEAINAIQNGQIGSIRAAASRFGVHQSTLPIGLPLSRSLKNLQASNSDA